MTSPAIPGRLGKVFVSTDAGATYIPVSGVVDMKPNQNLQELETTSHDSNGHREYIPNHDDATMDLNCRFLDQDGGQLALKNSLEFKKVLQIKYMFDSVQGHSQYTASCFPTKISPAAPLDGVATFDVTLRLSLLQRGVQPAPGP